MVFSHRVRREEMFARKRVRYRAADCEKQGLSTYRRFLDQPDAATIGRYKRNPFSHKIDYSVNCPCRCERWKRVNRRWIVAEKSSAYHRMNRSQ
jgi:hypothetical protein